MNPAKTEETSDFWNPPKIHENSVFVYQSKRLGNSVRFSRGTETLVAGYVALLCPHPLYFISCSAILYYLWFNVK